MNTNTRQTPRPALCAAYHPVTGETILIARGQSGYHPLKTRHSVESFNATLGVTPQEAEAMLAGSMFGWDCPAANPPLTTPNN